MARAYIACVTFADEQIGRLLDAWEKSPHAATGYIILWSDHGYMLGEKEGWSKMKPWFDSSHCNLMFAGPGIEQGVVCNKAVSLQDIYPTLLELLHLPKPAHVIDGNSLFPLLKNPRAEWHKPVILSHEEDGIRYDVVLDNHYRMTRLITGETELYEHETDPHEFTNLAGNPEYASVIERLAGHLSFRYPPPNTDGWVEAEAVPCQTSGEHGRRGNCHFPESIANASGGRVIRADLRAGRGCYIDFVIDINVPGHHALAVAASVGGPCTVSVAHVVDDALQADVEYPMKKVGDIKPTGGNAFTEGALSPITFDRPGLKLLRFVSQVPKQTVRIDRIRILKSTGPLEERIAQCSTLLAERPDDVRVLQLRGEAHFLAGHIRESIRDFDRVLTLAPARDPHHWQRGISYYYAGEYLKGRMQFERHRTVNPHDVENAAWHFLCVARLQGVAAARKAVIPIDTTRDTRIPMGEVYRLFAGTGTEEQVLGAAKQAPEARRREAMQYAHLYLGLWHEINKRPGKCMHHMKLSTRDLGMDHYMGGVARVHIRLRSSAVSGPASRQPPGVEPQ